MTNVLVVDDSAVDRALAGQLLKKEPGWIIDYANSGEEAVQKIACQPPDLVVTDLQMPHINGLQLVSIVRERYPQVPVVLMTAQGSEAIAFQALQLGAASYVPKALLPDHLRDTARRIIQISAQESSLRKVMDCLTSNDSQFSLSNDSTLFAPLVLYLQEQCLALGICGHADRVRIGVALSEALANALYHGNLELNSSLRESDSDAYHALADTRRRQSPYEGRRISVVVRLTRAKAEFVIRDEGHGFDPASLPDPTDPANLDKISGRGILLIKAFMDHVHYNAHGSEVTLIKERSCDQRP